MIARKKRRRARKVIGPKTAKAAARAGHKKVKVSFAKLGPSKWITRRASTGEPMNLAGTYRDVPTPNGGIIRCYYDPNTGNYDICHKIT
jgi:hypothetical protein